MGRNTAKRVSNGVFGDKWSTPYRVATTKSRPRQKQYSSDNIPRRRGYQSYTTRSARTPKPQAQRRGCWYWIAGLVLFAGTYNAIINPNKEDIVLIVMLWVVALIFFLYKHR